MLNETKYRPLLLNYTQWVNGGSGNVGMFVANGSASENHRVLGLDPWGRETVLWEARPDSVSGPDGGWNQSVISIDNSAMYRFSTWVKRNSNSNGIFYLGVYGYGSTDGVLNRSNGANNTNPYFWSGTTSFVLNQWYLVVGHVYPAGSGTGGNHAESGRYTVESGRIGDISLDYVWRIETTTGMHRSYLYYEIDTAQRQWWVYPRMDKCDGTEPSIAELLAGHDSRNIDLVRSIGGSVSKSLQIGSGGMVNIAHASECGITDGLVAWYRLDGDTKDYVGAADGVNSGATPTARGYSFNGTSSYINTGQKFQFSKSESFTVAFWVNYQNHSHKSTAAAGIIGKGHWYNNTWDILLLSYNNVQFECSGDPTRNGHISLNLGGTINTWYHFCVTYSNGSIVGYRDGIQVTTGNYSGTGNFSNNNDVLLGMRSGDTSRILDGLIDDVRIYNRALSAEEISILCEITNPDSPTKMKVSAETVYIQGQFIE